MFCHNCGKKLPDGLNFCTACGTKLIVPTVPADKASPVQGEVARSAGGVVDNPPPLRGAPFAQGGQDVVPAKKEKKSPLKAIAITAVCLVIVAAGVIGALHFTGVLEKDEEVTLSDRADRDEDKKKPSSSRDEAEPDDTPTAPDGGAFDNTEDQPEQENTPADAPAGNEQPAETPPTPAETPDAPAETPEAPVDTPEEPAAEPEPEVQVPDNPQATAESAAAYFAGLLQNGDWYHILKMTDVQCYVDNFDPEAIAPQACMNPSQALVLQSPNSARLTELALQGETAAGLLTFYGQLAAPEFGLQNVPENPFFEYNLTADEAALYAEALSSVKARDLSILGAARVQVGSEDYSTMLALASCWGADDYAEMVLFTEYHGTRWALGLSLVHLDGEWRLMSLYCQSFLFGQPGITGFSGSVEDCARAIEDEHGVTLDLIALPEVNLPDTTVGFHLEDFTAASPEEAVFMLIDLLAVGETDLALTVMDTILLTGQRIEHFAARNGTYCPMDSFYLSGELEQLNLLRAMSQNAQEIVRLRDFFLQPHNRLAAARWERTAISDDTGGLDPMEELIRYDNLSNALCVELDVFDLYFIENENAAAAYDALQAQTVCGLVRFRDTYYLLHATLVCQTVGPDNCWFVADLGLNGGYSQCLEGMDEDEAFEAFNAAVDQIMSNH